MKSIILTALALAAALALWVCAGPKALGELTTGRAVAGSRSNSASGLSASSLSNNRVGAPAPDFTLKRIDGSEVHLASFRGVRPVVLVFASYSCDEFRHHHELFEQVYDMHKERAAFFFVYIREAHPIDGWVSAENERNGISIEDPKNYGQRLALASTACSKLQITVPCLIDGLDNAVGNAYLAWPARVVLVDEAGKIAVLGHPMPTQFESALNVQFASSLGDVSRWLTKRIP